LMENANDALAVDDGVDGGEGAAAGWAADSARRTVDARLGWESFMVVSISDARRVVSSARGAEAPSAAAVVCVLPEASRAERRAGFASDDDAEPPPTGRAIHSEDSAREAAADPPERRAKAAEPETMAADAEAVATVAREADTVAASAVAMDAAVGREREEARDAGKDAAGQSMQIASSTEDDDDDGHDDNDDVDDVDVDDDHGSSNSVAMHAATMKRQHAVACTAVLPQARRDLHGRRDERQKTERRVMRDARGIRDAHGRAAHTRAECAAWGAARAGRRTTCGARRAGATTARVDDRHEDSSTEPRCAYERRRCDNASAV
jgi:hypothetical protein